MFKQGTFLILLGLIVAWGCKDSNDNSSDDLDAMQRTEIETFISDNELTATRHNDGFYYVVVQEAPGGRSQSEGSILSVYYTMSILGGSEISFVQAANGDPLRLNQGASAVVPVGLDTGLGLMREGEIYRFILPSSQAFGDLQFSTLIPSNSIIDVEVELVLIENEADVLALELTAINDYITDNNLNDLNANPTDSVEELNSELRFKRIAVGNDGETPAGLAGISYTGSFLNGNQFDVVGGSDIFEFSLGAGEVISGLDEGVRRMEVGERSLLIIPSSLGYGESVRVIPDILIDEMITRQVIPDYVAKVPPYEVLLFDVTLVQ